MRRRKRQRRQRPLRAAAPSVPSEFSCWSAPALAAALEKLESLILVKPGKLNLHQRLIRFADMMLTVKEKERFGKSCDTDGDLAWRVRRFVTVLLETQEAAFLKKLLPEETVPVRVKSLRRAMLAVWNDPASSAEAKAAAHQGLDDVQLALQLFGYQGDYATEDPTPERLAEQIEKLEEDLLGKATPKGRRTARVKFGPPIDLRPHAAGRARSGAAEVSTRLEAEISAAIKQA